MVRKRFHLNGCDELLMILKLNQAFSIFWHQHAHTHDKTPEVDRQRRDDAKNAKLRFDFEVFFSDKQVGLE